MQYDIFCQNQWFESKLGRLKYEMKRKEQLLKEVSSLRKKISGLKINISTITKGIPITAIEVGIDKIIKEFL